MFTFDNVIEARYTSSDQDTILVIYNYGDNGNVEVYIQKDSGDHRSLEAAGWNHERIVEITADWKRNQAKAMYDAAVRFLGKTYDDKIAILENEYKDYEEKMQKRYEKLQHLYGIGLFEGIFNHNENADLLFQAKLEILDKEVIKTCDKSVKAEIRKAKRISDLAGIVSRLL